MQRLSRRNANQAHKLVEQVGVPSSNLAKGIITKHAVTVSVLEGNVKHCVCVCVIVCVCASLCVYHHQARRDRLCI